jgi:mono/diheme cytochrome c family protein
MRSVSIGFVTLCLAAGSAWSQQSNTADDIAQGHHLAVEICAFCHLAAPDQRAEPILHPPAPPFAAIMQRKDVTAQSLTDFINKTHRGLDEPNGMPNPSLADYQVKQVVAYLMSLQK